MSDLVQNIAASIRSRVRAGSRHLDRQAAEMRSVFRGPPLHILRQVFDDVTQGGGITVERSGANNLIVPVLLQMPRLPDGTSDPAIGASGTCTEAHLLNLRNHPQARCFVALVPPGTHTSLSFSSASDEFGLAAENNSGSASIEDWWNDHFVQGIVEAAVEHCGFGNESSRDGARILMHEAIRAADDADRHDVSRMHAWQVLERVFSIPRASERAPSLVALACGFPPCANGQLDAELQVSVLARLAEFIEENGLHTGLDSLRADADEDDQVALTGLSSHLGRVIDTPTLFARATPFYYAPGRGDAIEVPPPDWWIRLTAERWIELLQEDAKPQNAIDLECTNSIIPTTRGVVPLVRDDVRLLVRMPEGHDAVTDVTITRQVSGKANTQSWTLPCDLEIEHADSSLPIHKTPARYSAEAPGFRGATLKVISLRGWEPGVVVFCRNARRISPPKKARSKKDGVAWECSVWLNGTGRHYFDLYVSQGVAVDDNATGYETNGASGEPLVSPVSLVSESQHGFEVEADSECHYDVRVRKSDGEWEVLRILISCEEVSAEGCASEFERLIRLNKQQEGGRAATAVQIDRTSRSSDLQTWILDRQNVERSFYPLVISSDYAAAWRAPDWQNRANTVLSKGKFLHDPRPTVEEMPAPDQFLKARIALAARIRGSDENGLIEAAKLGEMLAGDPEFASELEDYVQAYLAWLEADRDVATWADTMIMCRLEPDGSTLAQVPEAIVLNPFHPLRLAWQALAQRVLYQAYKLHVPCPAASILDPDCVPDILVLPLTTPAGGVSQHAFFSLECSSDYWTVMWNAARLDGLATQSDQPPFDHEFGVSIGGMASGFSVAQVKRALDDVTEMLSAKPVISVLVASSSGQTNACNQGIMAWCRGRFVMNDQETGPVLGARVVHILDERHTTAIPEDADISNLAEDTGNSVRWFLREKFESRPDLGIIAQLETSNARFEPIDISSAVGFGCLLRHRVRRQLQAGEGAFIAESRVGGTRAPSGDGLADKLLNAVLRIENAGAEKVGYTFAPSVHAIQSVLSKADFAAVSSSAVDPACFLGGWLPEGYLWDYDLPSYSHRPGDTNGYYLISRVKDIDRETLTRTLGNLLPQCSGLPEATVQNIIMEVASRGIPTVRGLSGGDTGATGDVGLFVASRLLQDEFRETESPGSLIPVLSELVGRRIIGLVIPIDPFRGYLDDLHGAFKLPQSLRPDMVVAGIAIDDVGVRIRLTPVEVKFRSSIMSLKDRQDALDQARCLATLLVALRDRGADQERILWRLAWQHLLLAMLGFGFRVYSQQRLAAKQSREWSAIHARVMSAILADEAQIEIDERGRLIIMDSTPSSTPSDLDGDGFRETIVLAPSDASEIVRTGSAPTIYSPIRAAVGTWALLPEVSDRQSNEPSATQEVAAPTEQTTAESGLAQTVMVTTSLSTGGPPPRHEASRTRPTDTVSTPADSAPTPAGMATNGIELLIGKTVDGFRTESRYLNLSDTRLNQLNIGVVGDLGTGKTQLLKAFVYRVSKAAMQNRGVRPRFLIFDYKKDYSSADFVEAVGAKVVIPKHLPVNVFDVSGAADSLTPWLDRFKFFSDVLDKIYSNIGPVQRRQLKEAVRTAYADCQQMGRQPTIYDVHAQYRSLMGNKADSPLSIIDDLVDMELFHPEPARATGFDQFLDGVVVIALHALGQDDRSKNMLVAIMLNFFYEHMLRITKRPYLGTDPQLRFIDSFLLVDEADNIMRYEFDVLRKILLQGREFGVGVILASQYLRHFKAGSTDYREPLLTWLVHKVPNVTPAELSALGLTVDVTDLAERIKTLQNHHCLYKSVGVSSDIVRATPFHEIIAEQASS